MNSYRVIAASGHADVFRKKRTQLMNLKILHIKLDHYILSDKADGEYVLTRQQSAVNLGDLRQRNTTHNRLE